MPLTRRDFLQSSTMASAAGFSALGAVRAASANPGTRTVSTAVTSSADKKVLILGGTRFLGPALVNACQARGWEVTLFNRGRSNPGLFPNLETIIGDRDPNIGDGLKGLEGRQWDAVFDTSGYVPRVAKASAELLAPNVGRYLFISSISVYGDPSKVGIVETDAVGTIDDPTVEEITGGTYGPLKALCEQTIEQGFGDRATIVRPGLIVGREDGTDRFTYWPVRVSQRGEVLSPGTPDDPVQIIDVRDLAEFSVHCISDEIGGQFNACGPAGTMSMSMMLHGCWSVSGGGTSFTWVPADFLAKHNIAPWQHMPVWIPPSSESAGICQASNQKAVDAGMTFRPLADTVSDTLNWLMSEPAEEQQRLQPDADYATEETPPANRRLTRRAGISRAKEQEVLAAWKSENH